LDRIREILEIVFLSNTVGEYLICLGLILLGFILSKYFARIIENLIYRFFKSSGVGKERLHQLLLRPLSFFIILIFVYIASDHLVWPEVWKLDEAHEFGLKMIVSRTYQTLFAASLIWVCMKLSEFVGLVILKKAETTEDTQDDQIVLFGIELMKISIMIIGFFFILGAVFKVNIATLIAGLGVGGLALALAAKESVENLLASFIIFLDKPFQIGDLVSVDSVVGTIEKVGFRSTRIRTLDKTYVTVPNRTLTETKLDNLSSRSIRRAKFNIGLTYDTTSSQIKDIMSDIQKVLDNHKKTDDSGLVKFTEFGDSALNIMVVFHINSPDYEEFLDVQEDVNFKIMEIVEAHKSDFAFPTKTIHLINEN
jgi:MscS family membrane protein